MSELYEIYIPPALIEKFKIACEFVQDASIEQRACLLNEIMLFNSFIAFDEDAKTLRDIRGISINGDCFQLNIERDND